MKRHRCWLGDQILLERLGAKTERQMRSLHLSRRMRRLRRLKSRKSLRGWPLASAPSQAAHLWRPAWAGLRAPSSGQAEPAIGVKSQYLALDAFHWRIRGETGIVYA